MCEVESEDFNYSMLNRDKDY